MVFWILIFICYCLPSFILSSFALFFMRVAAVRLAKYSSAARFQLQNLVNPVSAMNLPSTSTTSASEKIQKYQEAMNSSISKASWAKYSSGNAAFACFEADNRTSYQWPLSRETCRHFAIWCVTTRNLKSSSIKSYIAALKFTHHLKGLCSKHLNDDPILSLILKGITHQSLDTPKSPTRRVMTFSLLLTLGDKIAATNWDPLSKQVIWAAATTSFFASARLGEILASQDWAFSPSSDLTWKDTLLSSENSFLLRVKQP